MFNLFKPRPKYWVTPGGKYWEIYRDLLQEEHTLIAGAPGAGKSVMLNAMITTLLFSSPAKVQLCLIDPKQTELVEYRNLPHTLYYGNDRNSIAAALRVAVTIIDNRLSDMARRGLKKWDGARVFVVIDELLDIMTDKATKKICYPMLQKIAALGRAPGVTLIACTQSPVAIVLPTPFKACFPNRIALRVACAQDSRNIIQQAGAERFPNPRIAGEALAYIRRGAELDLYKVPTYEQKQHDFLVRYWLSDACRKSA